MLIRMLDADGQPISGEPNYVRAIAGLALISAGKAVRADDELVAFAKATSGVAVGAAKQSVGPPIDKMGRADRRATKKNNRKTKQRIGHVPERKDRRAARLAK